MVSQPGTDGPAHGANPQGAERRGQAPGAPLFNDVPLAPLLLIGAITLVSGLIMLGPDALSDWLLGASAVVAGATGPQLGLAQPLGPFAPYGLHVLAHGGWAHLATNMAMLLAFGVGMARWFGGTARGVAAFLALFFLSAIVGALAETLLHSGPPSLLVGASSGVSGLVGASVFLMAGRRAGSPPALFSRAYLVNLAPWAAINLGGLALEALFPGGVFGTGPIAWTAHLGGLFAGALLFWPLTRATQRRL